MQSALNNLVRRHILVIAITKDRLLGGARLHHSARSVFFHRWRDDWIRLLIVAADEFFSWHIAGVDILIDLLAHARFRSNNGHRARRGRHHLFADTPSGGNEAA